MVNENQKNTKVASMKLLRNTFQFGASQDVNRKVPQEDQRIHIFLGPETLENHSTNEPPTIIIGKPISV